jgi:hypothetical protein
MEKVTIDYGDGEKQVEISFMTCLVYEHEFKADLIADVMGSVKFRSNVLSSADGVVEMPVEQVDDDFVFDYHSISWVTSVKALWACLKTADASVPSFMAWAATLPPSIDMWEIVTFIRREVETRLFRHGAADSE